MCGETTHTLMQYRGVVHCVGGDNTHTCSIGGWSTVCGETTHTLMQYRGVVHCGGETTHTLMQYRGVVHCVWGDNTHTNAV